MTTTDLKEFKHQVHAQYKRRVDDGGKMTAYFCHHCNLFVVTRRPSKKQVSSKGYWDSAVQCTECGNLNFVKERPDGKTESIKL